MENDSDEEVRTSAAELLANKFPAAFYGWLEALVLASPKEFPTDFLGNYYCKEPVRHLRDLTLLAAMLVKRNRTTDRLIDRLCFGDTAARIRAAEAFCRFPAPEAEEALVKAVKTKRDAPVVLYALHALGHCGSERGLALLNDVAEEEGGNVFGQAARRVLESLADEEDASCLGRLFQDSDFQILLARLRSAEKPPIAGSVRVRGRVESALRLLKEKTPRLFDFLCVSVSEIAEGDLWSSQSGDKGRIFVCRDEVVKWPADRIAYELIYHASLLYQKGFFPSPVLEALEGGRDQFWTALALAKVPALPDSRVRRFFEELLGCAEGDVQYEKFSQKEKMPSKQ
jgi:hypothetical protein